MTTAIPHPLPTDGKVVAVRGSPGPAAGIRVDVVLRGANENMRWNNKQLVNLPTEFDVTVPVGSGVAVVWVGNRAELNSLGWRPVVEDCDG